MPQLIRSVTFAPLLLMFVVALSCIGCGNTSARQKLMDEAQQSVEAGLEAWKRGEKPASLLSLAQAIEFFDEDWNRSVTLVDYKVQQAYLERDGTPRCAVELTLQVGAKPPKQTRVTYELVKKEDRLVIARDPMS
jgi:hypothetical protein